MNAYDRTQKIDDYLENNMSNEEKKEFERLLSDPSASLGGSMNLNVKEEVKMQKAIIQEIQRRALRDTLMDENRRYRARQRVIPKIITLSSSVSATAIAAVMLIMFMLAPAKDYVQKVSSDYAMEYYIIQKRGNPALDSAIIAIANNKWEDAEECLKDIYISDSPKNLTGNQYDDWFEYHWLKALCEMHDGHVIKTKYHLRKIEKEMIDVKDPMLVKAKELKELIERKQRKLIRK